MNLSTVQIPTQNLILRPIDESYAGEIFTEFTEEITLYMLPQPSKNLDAAVQFIRYSQEGLRAGTNLQLVILKQDTLEFIGCIGLHHIGNPDPEIGLWIKKSAHGNAYGLESATALIAWAKANIEYEYLRYPVDKRNIASRKIPEKNNGVIKNEYKKINQKGVELDEVEYWIYNQ